MDDVGLSNWHNQHNESSEEDSTEDEGLDDPMDKDNFPIFILNGNDTRSQLTNLADGFYEVDDEFTRVLTLD